MLFQELPLAEDLERPLSSMAMQRTTTRQGMQITNCVELSKQASTESNHSKVACMEPLLGPYDSKTTV